MLCGDDAVRFALAPYAFSTKNVRLATAPCPDAECVFLLLRSRLSAVHTFEISLLLFSCFLYHYQAKRSLLQSQKFVIFCLLASAGYWPRTDRQHNRIKNSRCSTFLGFVE